MKDSMVQPPATTCFGKLPLVTLSCLAIWIGFSPLATATPLDRSSARQPGAHLIENPQTLERRYDIVVVTGDLLGTLMGKEISHLRVYAHRNGIFQPIPYQIDERDAKGEFVYTGGDLAGQDTDRGRFDLNDELVFECSHLGDRVARDLWPEGANAGDEIEASDPRDTSKKGWAYILYFPQNPPAASREDYVNYDPGRDRVMGRFYTVGYKKGFTLFTDLIYPKEYGGSGEDMLDRVKIRIDVQLVQGMVHVRRSEKDMRCRVVGWKDGPIRVMRNTENTFRILFNIPSPSLFSVTEYYPHYFTVPMRFSIPFSMKWVMNSFVISGFAITAYGDFLTHMIGGRAYSNRNPDGITFTGRTPYEELKKKYDLSKLVWGYFAKEGVGMWFPRMAFPDPFLQFMQLYARDEVTLKDPPEDEPGVIGCGALAYSQSLQGKLGVPRGKGFTSDMWDTVQKGNVELSLDTYIASPRMKPNEMAEWLDIRDHPILVDVPTGQKVANLVVGETNSSLVKAVIFDRKGRQIHLRDLAFHIGSARTTGWDYLIGYQVEKDKWHTVPLAEIRRMDFRIVENDPKTGLPSPLYITVTRKDSSTIDLLNAKSASFAGHVGPAETVCIWNHLIERIEIRGE